MSELDIRSALSYLMESKKVSPEFKLEFFSQCLDPTNKDLYRATKCYREQITLNVSTLGANNQP